MRGARLPEEEEFLRRYPSQLSLGEAQRVLIAMALLHRSSLLTADEPTSSLDLLTQAEILELFRELKVKLGTSILFISHDLLSVASISQRIAVIRVGTIVECRLTKEIFSDPQHPYTQQLVRSLPAMPQWLARSAAG